MKKIEFKRSYNNHTYFYGIELKEPTKAEFDKYRKIWFEKYDNEFNKDFNHELLLDNVFKDNNHSNKAIKEMYIKCVLLDKLYSTNIKYMDDLIFHLSQIDNFETMLEIGDAELVDIMKKVKKRDGETINYLSFASKYCRRYNPSSYPIYDNVVKEVLKHYISTINFYKSNKQVDFSNYVSYKNVIDEFIKAYPFVGNYIMLDQFLWTMGKEKLIGINLVKKIRKNADDKKELNKIAKSLNQSADLSADELEQYVVNKYELL